MNCVVLRVRSRAEKKVKYLCSEYKIPCYLPTYLKSKKYQRRTVTTEFPLFPGYVFVSLSDDDKKKRLLGSGLIISSLAGPNQRELVHQLRAIKKLLTDEPNSLTVSNYKTGEVLLIVDGPFKGTRGVVERVNNKKSKIALNIEIIGQSVVVEVENEQLESLD
jgi:transcription antitermination factor NusG